MDLELWNIFLKSLLSLINNHIYNLNLKIKLVLIALIFFYKINMGIGDWGLGIGDWGLGIGPNPQSPIPNPQFKLSIL
jgi:hypothetical protein